MIESSPPSSPIAGTAAPVWLGDRDPVFGMYHAALGEPHPLAVLFCAPFGWEDMGSHPIRRAWAQRLAAAGHPALRFDLPGTGQSAGGPADDDLVARWLDAIADAATWLRQTSGAGAVAALGIGMGALLALEASAQGAPLDDLVLWGLPLSGRGLVRKLRAFAALQSADDASGDDALPDGWLESGGYVLSDRTLDDLARLRVDREPAPRLRRALLLEGAAPDGEQKALTALDAAGVSVRLAPGAGYVEMLDRPNLSRVPEATVALVGEWCDGERAVTGEPQRPVPSAASHGLIDAGGITVRESQFSVPTPQGTIVGILAEPDDPGRARHDVCLIGLPAMAERSIGPNRLWVELARRYAAQGITVLRTDLLSIGESDGDLEVMYDFQTVVDPDRTAQIRRIMDALQERRHTDRFLLAGLCSGGGWAQNVAWVDERVQGLLILNPGVLPDAHARIMRDAASRPLRVLLRADTWRRLLRGEASIRGGARQALNGLAHLFALARTRSAPDTLPGGVVVELPDADRPPSYRGMIERVGEHDGRVVFGVCRVEPGHRLLEIEGIIDEPAQWPQLTMRTFASSDHDMRSVTDQRIVHELADILLAPELAREALPAATA